MAVIGRVYGTVWRKAVVDGQMWTAQYIMMSALSIYLVMQTMEAVIFRLLILSTPVLLVWRSALRTGNVVVPGAEALEIVGQLDAPDSLAFS
jgi:hypothetical protein